MKLKIWLFILLGLMPKFIFSQQGVNPRNIILMIGDGMGLSQISGAYYANGGELSLLQFPYTGIMSVHGVDHLVPDSGSSGTSISSGVKTFKSAIGVDRDTQPVKTIMEELKDRGFKTGIVVTSKITHATPAAFYAHQKSRHMNEEIAGDLVLSGIDIFVGGGKNYFYTRKTDRRNLIKELNKNGYLVQDLRKESWSKLNFVKEDKLALFTADGDPTTVKKGRDYLPEATAFSIDFLKKKATNGFFLMVEGSQIDWGGHDNDVEFIILEMLDFDKAISNALEFAKKDGETLVIVLADHETGGMSINEGSQWNNINSGFATKEHTATFVPVFAYGPGAKNFTGFFDNTALKGKIISALNSKDRDTR
jgi:alkaline phosphatase